MTPEAKAREKIDAMLLQCGWIVQDYKSLNLSAGRGVAVREVPITSGRCAPNNRPQTRWHYRSEEGRSNALDGGGSPRSDGLRRIA